MTERFDDAAVQKTIEVDLAPITYYDELLKDLELCILKTAKQHDAYTLGIFAYSLEYVVHDIFGV